MAVAWHGGTVADEIVDLGPVALIHPLLQRLDVAGVIDRHLPPDPQLEFSHGQILSMLLAARLSEPTALINVPAWAEKTGAELLWNIPADSSWLLLLGLGGHAFISTALVAATFVFYQDRYRWWIEMRQTLMARAEADRRGLNRKA